jgi:hypothetical protein
MPCNFPEHHGHGGGAIPSAVVAVAALAAVGAVVATHAAGITDALFVVLAVLGSLAAGGVVWLVRLLSGGRSAVVAPPALPSAASSRRAVTAGRRQLPAPVRIKAIGPPARPVHVLTELPADRTEAAK